MPHFLEIPQAVEFIAGQAWLTPPEIALQNGNKTTVSLTDGATAQPLGQSYGK